MNKLILALASALALPAMAGCSESGDGTMTEKSTTAAQQSTLSQQGNQGEQGVHQQLQVNATGGKVIVTLTLENGGAVAVFAPKAVYVDDEIFRREFQITNKATGAEVDYIGPMVKRAPYTKDDYLAVQPGKTRSNSIDITRSFDFKPGRSYKVAYSGAYLHDLAKLDAGTTSSSAAPKFTFTAK